MFFKLFASVLLISSTLAQASSSNSKPGTPVPPPVISSPVAVRVGLPAAQPLVSARVGLPVAQAPATAHVGPAPEETVQVCFPSLGKDKLLPLTLTIYEVEQTRAIEHHTSGKNLSFCRHFTKDGNCSLGSSCKFVHSMKAYERFNKSQEQVANGNSPISNVSVGYIIEEDNSPANADDEFSSRSISPVDSPYLVRQAAAPHLIFYSEGKNKYRHNPYGLKKPHAEEDQE